MQTAKTKKNIPADNGHKVKESQSIGTQTEILSMNYIPPNVLSGFQLESEAFPNFFYKPHMVVLLVTLCGIISYSVLVLSQPYSEQSFITNARMYFLRHSCSN